MKTLLILSLLICVAVSPSCAQADRPDVVTGAQRMDLYLPLLAGRKVGLLTNHTAIVGQRHLVDTLISAGVDVRVVFAPEHGFRGDADAGAHIKSYKDPQTGVEVFSVYGKTKKPPVERVAELDVLVFDIQDVGMRYYTYLSSMHYLMESCAQAGVPLIVLDRPNPNGMYVDGPVLDMKHKSFVGMHPIPVVHGMTLGELAGMINGEGWLEGGVRCDLTVVPCENYTHQTLYRLPVAPSPNLPNMRSVYLYASLCFFEATPVSIGRGTDFPFQVYGHPDLPNLGFDFTPVSRPGATNPPQKDKKCYGVDLGSGSSDERIIRQGVNLQYLIDAYNQLEPDPKKFFTKTFELLTGVDYVRGMIVEGRTASEIRERWREDVERFKTKREPYLLYEEFDED